MSDPCHGPYSSAVGRSADTLGGVSVIQAGDPAAAGMLAAARAGDGEAFRDLVGPHLRALHVHAYRMLGSLDDADEALQDSC